MAILASAAVGNVNDVAESLVFAVKALIVVVGIVVGSGVYVVGKGVLDGAWYGVADDCFVVVVRSLFVVMVLAPVGEVFCTAIVL